MLRKRLLTTFWLTPIVLAAIWFNGPFPWFTMFVAVWGGLAAREFYSMAKANNIAPLSNFGVVWVVFFILSPYLDSFPSAILLTSAVTFPLIGLMLRRSKENAFANWVWTIAGIIYIGWLMSYFVTLIGLEHGKDWVFLAILITIGSDASAYFTGRAVGRHRLAPSISPNKTWEGTFGGTIGAIVSAFILGAILSIQLSTGQTILIGLLVSVFGQFGDLAESLCKRNMGVKDSGQAIPGHGGFLDRSDSIAFAGIAVYYFALAYNAGWLNWL